MDTLPVYESNTFVRDFSTEDKTVLVPIPDREPPLLKNITESTYLYDYDFSSTNIDAIKISLLAFEIVSAFEKWLKVEFSEVKDVDSIYIEQYQEKTTVIVLLSNEIYDDSLMDDLLDRELRIRNLMPSYFYLDFLYIPLLGLERQARVPQSAKQVYAHKASS
jgi:hypothetical protein